MRGLGRSPSQLKHLIFTYGHPDHIGSAAAIVRETGARTYMHPLDIPIAESGGPFRPMRAAPGLLRQVMCNLFFHPDERLEPVGQLRRSVPRYWTSADGGGRCDKVRTTRLLLLGTFRT